MAYVPGTPGPDTLSGTPQNDTLDGLAGDDRLFGDAGADDLRGGAGTRDIADYRASPTGVTVDLVTGLGTSGDAAGDVLSGIERLVGSDGDDMLTGDAGDNRLAGRAGDDTLSGGGGNDTLVGGRGADMLDGGDGGDRLRYDWSNAGVTIDLEAGTASGGFADGDTISGFEAVTGSRHDDQITGDSGDNILAGRAGDDTLSGGGGNDTLVGGRGADVLDGCDGIDTVSYHQATEGVAVDLRTPQSLGGAAGDTLISIEVIRGSRYDDSIIMGDGDNVLAGRDGDDFLDGGAGNDTLNGGAGADFLHGGDGIDTVTYRQSDAAVHVSLTLGPNTGGHAEGDTFSWIHNITGSMFSDSIEGDSLDNRLRGLDGDDTLIGRGGHDLLVGGDGADTFVFVAQDEHTGQVQGIATSVAPYAGSEHDRIRDFERGADSLQFTATEFSGPVVNTDDLTDLDFDSADDSAFVYDGQDLYYVDYASQADFDAGLVTVRHIAHLDGVAELSADDFTFV